MENKALIPQTVIIEKTVMITGKIVIDNRDLEAIEAEPGDKLMIEITKKK